MMYAAIYARKSTAQSGVAEDQKSVTRQIEHATAYAHAKGWTVRPEHIYVDDGISGAEFANRPGFLRLMNAVKPRAPFHALVLSEESRLGREAIETAYALKQLVAAHVRVFFYLEDRERTLDSPTDKVLLSLTTFADEVERERARQRTYDALSRKAKAGYVTGGQTFGYTNVRVDGHVERRIDETEAAVVRRIFALSAAGAGLTRIAKTLNGEGVATPRAQQGRPSGWVASSVRGILRRSTYRGELVWNQTRKRDRWGQRQQHARPDSEWFRRDAPELRIVSDADWWAAHRQMDTRRAAHATGSRPHRETPYLLSGFARCAVCGGGFASHLRPHGARGHRQRVCFYACTSHWKRGATVCRNRLVGRMEEIDREVLATLQNEILRPAVIEQALARALERLHPKRVVDQRTHAEAAIAKLDAECRRLAEAIGRGGRMDALVERLTACQAQRDAVRAQLPATVPQQLAHVTERLHAKCADWCGLLTRNVEQGRAVLRALLVEPFRFTPVDDGRRRGYAFTATLALDRVVDGVIALPVPETAPVLGGEWSSGDTAREIRQQNQEQIARDVASPTGFGVTAYWPLVVDGYADLRVA